MHEIESAKKSLDYHALRQLCIWFDAYLAEKWERRFASDVVSGKLDKLGAAADRAFEQGKCRSLDFTGCLK
jgi:hypothetical protein